MILNEKFNAMLNSPFRALRARAEFYEGSALTLLCGCHDNLISFDVERIGESKFFGYGVCQKANVKLIDKERNINLTTDNTLEIEFGVGSDYIYPFPNFYITEVHRNEKDNTLSITAYDALYRAAEHTVSELELEEEYTIKDFARACARLLGLPLNTVDESFNTSFPTGANFDGTETIREALNAVAEATQTIYFINWDWKLTFVSLLPSDTARITIDKEKYFKLDSGDNRRLSNITNATELGDNVTVTTGVSGSTQYVRNNPFWDLREDIDELLQAALDKIGNLTINQFNCKWRGNFLAEIGDKLELITKDNKSLYSYLLNDTISFDGSLEQVTEWSFEADGAETESNPVSLGETLKQTYAKVDKANKQVEIVASEVEGYNSRISTLELNTGSISASVSEDIAELNKRVEATISASDVDLKISSALDNGVNKVETITGFKFNDDGLTVSKSGSEITTAITEDGMKVEKSGEIVLTANNEGVKAIDLHATTFLVIGTNSRFENYGSSRTGCFWIGGTN